MNDDVFSEVGPKKDLAPKERVEELFKLADIVVDALADSAAYDHQTVVSAKLRLKQLIGDQDPQSTKLDDKKRHAWIVNAIEEISNYAETEGLETLRGGLHGVKQQFEDYLREAKEIQQSVGNQTPNRFDE